MKRFIYKKQSHTLTKLLICAGLMLAIVVFFVQSVSSLSEDTANRQRDTLEKAVNRCITSCYITEGSYPESLEYMTQNYGLVYNHELFYIDYKAYGANVMPDVTIITKNREEAEK